MSGRNDFSSTKKTAAQESGLFLTSAIATSALSTLKPLHRDLLLVLPIFLWHINVIESQSAIYSVSGVSAIVLAIVLYQVFFNIKEESW